MSLNSKARFVPVMAIAAFALGSGIHGVAAVPEPKEPIAYIGHGAFFDANGTEIVMTPAMLESVRAYYEARILPKLGARRQGEFRALRLTLTKGLDLSAAEEAFASQAALTRTAQAVPLNGADVHTLGKLRALEYRMRRGLMKNAVQLMFFGSKAKANLEILRRVDAYDGQTKATKFLMATPNRGKAYVEECAAAGVPIPPPIGQLDPAGTNGWKSEGFLKPGTQFIINSPAELRSYESPQGMCYALPRYDDESRSTVALDGVICLSKATAKVCFWDNQMNGRDFAFPNGTRIPIGFPDTSVNAEGLYQAGGEELDNGAGGVCSDCHSGANPYIVHPRLELNPGVTWGSVEDALPAFGADRATPLVPASWPQNEGSLADAATPKACAGCHSEDGGAGRLPQLTAQLRGYCGTILPQAITRTMPPRKPGSQASDPEVVALLELCKAKAMTGPS